GTRLAATRPPKPGLIYDHFAQRRRAGCAVHVPTKIAEILMIRPPERRFLYKGHAVALAATFTKPRAEYLEAQAAVALPVTGGIASATVENFSFRDIVKFKHACSHATGTFNSDSGAYNTLVTSVTEGFNILGVVTADAVVARLASKHFIDAPHGKIRV